MRTARFAAIPAIPLQGLSDWQFQTMNAMKENIDLLTGAKGYGSGVNAITSGSITVGAAPAQSMQRVTASGEGFTISGERVAGLDDYGKLILDVQNLANDVAALRNTLNTLIAQLKR